MLGIMERLKKIERRIVDLYNLIREGFENSVSEAPEDGQMYGREDGEWVVIESNELPEGFFIATQLASSKLIYQTDSFKELDLQPYVSTIITNTNEIIRNGNDLYVAGNFSNDNSLQAIVISITNCRIKDGEFIFDEIKSTTIVSPVHAFVYHDNFLFLASRSTQTIIIKINPYDLADKRTLTLPNTVDFLGRTTDIIAYKNKLYILVSSADFSASKFIEINEDLIQYKLLFSIPVSAQYYNIAGNPFLIYNDEIYIPCMSGLNSIAFRVYDLQGNIRRQKTGIVINFSGTINSYPIPHWMGIFNDKILISFSYHRSLVRLDCFTLNLEESVPLTSSITDDNTIRKDGYIYLNGEKDIYDVGIPVELLKVKYSNFTDYNILISNYNNGNGSYGSINTKVILDSLKIPLINKIVGSDNLIIGELGVPSQLTAPNLTIALITTGGNKSIVTKEYVDSSMQAGETTFTLDGIQTIFDIPHTLGVIPKSISLTFSDGGNLNFIQSLRTRDASKVRFTCTDAPSIGSQTVYWQVYR